MIVEIRTARRQWTCSWCGQTIHPGQSYLQIGGARGCCEPPGLPPEPDPPILAVSQPRK